MASTAVDEKKEEKEASVADEDKSKDNADDNDDEKVKAVAERLKFFFSDANIRQDTFIRSRLLPYDKSPPGGGSVPIEALARFNTIKKYTTDEAVIVKAAESLPNLLVLRDDNKSIGLVDPFTKEKMYSNIPVSLSVSNIPVHSSTEEDGTKEPTHYAVTLDQVRDLFVTYGTIAIVKFRFKNTDDKKKKGVPNGVAVVEFETEEDFQKAADDVLTTKDGISIDPKRKLVLGGNTLVVQSLKEYLDERKKRKELDGEGKEDDEGTKKRKHEDDANDTEDDKPPQFNPRCVIELKGLSATCDREAILKATSECMNLTIEQVKEKKVFVDFSRGRTDGAIRFDETSNEVDDLATKLNSGDVKIDGAKVELARVLEGDDEVQYWKNYADFKKKQRQHYADEKYSKKRKGGHRGGHHGGHRKRR